MKNTQPIAHIDGINGIHAKIHLKKNSSLVMHSNSKNFLFCTFFGFFQYKLTVNVQTTSILGKYANRKIGTYMKRSCSGSVVLEFCSHFVEIDNGKNVRLKLVLSWPCMNSKYPLVTIILFAK